MISHSTITLITVPCDILNQLCVHGSRPKALNLLNLNTLLTKKHIENLSKTHEKPTVTVCKIFGKVFDRKPKVHRALVHRYLLHITHQLVAFTKTHP